MKNLHKKDHVIWFEAGASYRDDGIFVNQFWAKGGKLKYSSGQWKEDTKDIKTFDISIREPEASILKINKLPRLKDSAPKLYKRMIGNTPLWEKMIPDLEEGLRFSSKDQIYSYINSLDMAPAQKTSYKNKIKDANLRYDIG
jgi:hypothetical protein